MQETREKEYAEALAEVRFILNYTDEELVRKIPKAFWKFLDENEDKEYKVTLTIDKPLEEQVVKEKTKNLMAIIYRNYFCTPEEKAEYDKILLRNQQKYEEELKEKYSYENLFKDSKPKTEKADEISQQEANNNLQMIEYRENIFKKLFNKIKNFFSRKG